MYSTTVATIAANAVSITTRKVPLSDDVSLLRVINTPKRGIGLKTIENLTYKADEQYTSIYEAIDSGKELEFKNLIERLKEVEKLAKKKVIHNQFTTKQ